MYVVADYMQKNGLRFDLPIRAAFSMSETVQAIYRETIERAWHCPLWDQYGQGERVASITLRECGCYHYDMDFGIVEFEPVGKEGDLVVAEVIGTSLINRAWTLLRYRTGDMVLIDPDGECPCGRPGPVIRRVLGRTGDILTMPDGRRILNITTAVKDVPGLLEFQIVHDEPSSVIVNIVRDAAYTERSEQLIRKRVTERCGPSATVTLRYPERIERTPGGKFMAVVSKV